MVSKNKPVSKAKIYLDVGGGLEPLTGYINVDAYSPKADIPAFAWDLPYESGTVSGVNCSHVLEHIEKARVLPTLREFYRVLRPGGSLILEVPDLVWCCNNWLAKQDNAWALDAIFGNQDDAGQFHKTGFNQERLLSLVREAGFTQPVLFFEPWSHEQKCLHVEVYK